MKDNTILQNIKERRSVRKFLEKPIEAEVLDAILEAGLYAPNAASKQSPIIAVCKNREINAKLGEINFDELVKIQSKRPGGSAGFSGKGDAFYSAPVVLTIFAPKDWYNFTIDCAVAGQNIMLAAHSLGVSSCMIGRALETFESEYGLELKKQWGIEENYEGKIHVILGYSDATGTAKPRNNGRIINIG